MTTDKQTYIQTLTHAIPIATDRQTDRAHERLARMYAYRLAKKLENPTEKAKMYTPHPNFRSLSPSELLRGMGVSTQKFSIFEKK